MHHFNGHDKIKQTMLCEGPQVNPTHNGYLSKLQFPDIQKLVLKNLNMIKEK